MEIITKTESCISGLKKLLDKYNTPVRSEYNLEIGKKPVLVIKGQKVNILNWRYERKYQELKKLLTNGTMGEICVIRICSINQIGSPLENQIYRELDLCEWLSSSKIQSVFAVMNGNTANIIVRLENDALCTVEVASTLPEGTHPIERHEINTTQGVASDQIVDTQIPQKSIYVYSEEKYPAEYTDTDFELYGLLQDEISVVRAAFDVLKNMENIAGLKESDNYLNGLVEAVHKSALEGRKITLGVNK